MTAAGSSSLPASRVAQSNSSCIRIFALVAHGCFTAGQPSLPLEVHHYTKTCREILQVVTIAQSLADISFFIHTDTGGNTCPLVACHDVITHTPLRTYGHAGRAMRYNLSLLTRCIARTSRTPRHVGHIRPYRLLRRASIDRIKLTHSRLHTD